MRLVSARALPRRGPQLGTMIDESTSDHQGHLRPVRNGSSVKRGVDDVRPALMVPVGLESL
jgi:hypothetical protein